MYNPVDFIYRVFFFVLAQMDYSLHILIITATHGFRKIAQYFVTYIPLNIKLYEEKDNRI